MSTNMFLISMWNITRRNFNIYISIDILVLMLYESIYFEDLKFLYNSNHFFSELTGCHMTSIFVPAISSSQLSSIYYAP